MKIAEYERGSKNLLHIGFRRVAKAPFVSDNLPKMTEFAFGSLWSGEVHHLREKLFSKLAQSDIEQLVSTNLIFFPNEVFLRASPFHYDNWTRDSFYTCLAVNEPEAEMHLLGNFTKRGYRYPQVPTTRLIFTDREWYFDDESTALALIWRAKLAQHGMSLSTQEMRQWEDRLGWLVDHSEDGSYVTPAGTERSWLDTFVFKKPDVVAYDQGIYTASLIAAERMSLRLPKAELNQAMDAYNCMAHPLGRLRFSRNHDFKDASSLTGEFLVNELFDVSFLPPVVVVNTVETLDRTYGGYKVVTRDMGGFLGPDQFNTSNQNQKGSYHDGGEWPLFSTMARFTAERNGLTHDNTFWYEALDGLLKTKDAEFRNTLSLPQAWDHARENHAWNALAHSLIQRTVGQGEYLRALSYLS